jgi:hypothetical protein
MSAAGRFPLALQVFCDTTICACPYLPKLGDKKRAALGWQPAADCQSAFPELSLRRKKAD